MGAWSTSITGNDTAQDLLSEYTAAFFKYDIDEAVQRIDEYVRAHICDESDAEEWCDYFYSLADFMWKKGVLTEEIRQRAIGMIDSGFGLDVWAESGPKTLASRQKALASFREKLLSPMPPRKKIKPRTYTERIFEDGDVIAIQLQTAGKPYTENDKKPMSEEEFHAMDGKYVLLQMVGCHASWSSRIVPEVKDYWAHFRLFDGVYDEVPADIDVATLPLAKLQYGQQTTSVFYCGSSMFHFKKRNYRLLGNRKELVEDFNIDISVPISLGTNLPHINGDSELLSGMGMDLRLGPFTGTAEELAVICRSANRCARYRYLVSKEENERLFAQEEEQIAASIAAALANGAQLLSVSFGREIGVVTVTEKCIGNLYIACQHQRKGFGTMLLAHAFSLAQPGAYIDVPKKHAKLLHICKKLGLQEASSDNPDFIRMVKACCSFSQ